MRPTLPPSWEQLTTKTWHLVAEGESDASVYRLTDANTVTYLKITDASAKIPVHDDYTRLQWLQDKVPVPQIIDYATTETHQFLLMSACDGLHPLHDDLSWHAETRLAVLAKATQQVHSLDASDCPFRLSFDDQLAIARDNIDQQRINLVRWQKQYSSLSVEEGFANCVSLKPTQADNVVTHGDLYPVNIRVDEYTQEITGFIDCGRCAIADRYTDLALIVNALSWHLDASAINTFFAFYGMPIDADKLRFYQLLDFFR